MRLATFLFFLPTLAATGYFSEHVEKYLNKDVDPCDDFYEHVCPIAIAKGRSLAEEGRKRYFSFIYQMSSPTITEFYLRVMTNIKTFPEASMEPEDSDAFTKLVEASQDRCTQLNVKITDTEYLAGILAYEAHFRLQSTPHFNTLKNKMMNIFLVLKDIIIKEFSEALWTKRYPDLVNLLKTVKMVHLDNEELYLEQEIEEIKLRYDQCLGITTNFTQTLAESCINYAVCPSKSKLIVFNYNQKQIAVPLVKIINSYLPIALKYNAQYSRFNTLFLFHMFYTMEEDELPYMLGSVDFVMSHEIGHVFFNGHAIPSNTDCFRRHMQNTCNLYLDKANCTIYDEDSVSKPPVKGNYSRLIDDGADWVGMHTSLKAMEYYLPQVTHQNPASEIEITKNVETLQKFFYANAIAWCTTDPLEGDETHSPHKVRVNGIASMFPEFSKAFSCKRGSKMAKAATCLPFAGVGAPTSKRNVHQ